MSAARNRNSVSILGVGVVTPAGASLEQVRTARWSETSPRETAQIAPPQGMTVRDQRRQARLTRLALYAADQAAEMAGVRGRDAGIYMGLTHGTATFLREFHDYLFDFGPEMASPNAFSSGVTNAPLGAISLHQKLSQGGATLVGIEDCGLAVLNHAAGKITDGTHELCYAGACEEYASIVEDVYHRLGWYGGRIPPALPWPLESASGNGVGVSEGSVVCVLSRVAGSAVTYTALTEHDVEGCEADMVISCAGGGPSDAFELAWLTRALARMAQPVPVLFPKLMFGETFAAGSLLGLAVGWDALSARVPYDLHPCHESIASRVAHHYEPEAVSRVLVLAAARDGSFSAGLLSRG